MEAYLLQSPVELPFHPTNPIQRPEGVHFGIWLDSLETLAGRLLGSQLGVHSGYFQECLNWDPNVSFLFDSRVRLVQLLYHPATQNRVRDASFLQETTKSEAKHQHCHTNQTQQNFPKKADNKKREAKDATS